MFSKLVVKCAMVGLVVAFLVAIGALMLRTDIVFEMQVKAVLLSTIIGVVVGGLFGLAVELGLLP